MFTTSHSVHSSSWGMILPINGINFMMVSKLHEDFNVPFLVGHLTNRIIQQKHYTAKEPLREENRNLSSTSI